VGEGESHRSAARGQLNPGAIRPCSRQGTDCHAVVALSVFRGSLCAALPEQPRQQTIFILVGGIP
jgi:hypothetical protein